MKTKTSERRNSYVKINTSEIEEKHLIKINKNTNEKTK